MKNTANLSLLNICLIIIYSINLYSANNSYQNEFDKLLNNKNTTEKFKILQDSIDNCNDFNKALAYSDYYLNFAKKSNLESDISKAYLNLGATYFNSAIYRKSVENLLQSIASCKKSADTVTQISANIYLGLVYSRFSDTANIEKYYLEALRLSKLSKNTFQTASSLWNLSFLESVRSRFDKSYKYLEESLSYLKQMPNQNDNEVLFGYGLISFYKAGYFTYMYANDSAIYYFKKTIEIEEKINKLSMIAQCYSEISVCQNYEHRYYEAIKYCKLGIPPALASSNILALSIIYSQLAVAYDSLNQPVLAYENYKKFKLYSDSIAKNDSRLLSAKYDLVSAEEQFNQQNLMAKKKESLMVIVSLSIIILLILISFIIYYRYRLKSKYGKELSELNATKDKFFTIISHDLKTPVSGFHNLAVLLNDYYPDFTENEKLKHLNSLKESSGNILKLLENLLTWARVQTDRIQAYPGKLDIINLINTEILVQTPAARKKNISIEYRTEAEIESFVYADEDMISAVVRNLLSNAVKYTYPDGVISIRTEDLPDSIKIEITDNGIGIREEDKHKLFRLDLKHSTNGSANEKGTGLGLNLCKEFVERNNGKIAFESEFGKGATFVFTLPKG